MPKGENSPAERITGVVAWFDDKKGFGFIARENEEDVFVHQSSILMKGHRTLEPNQMVEFSIGTIGGRRPSAQEVVVL